MRVPDAHLKYKKVYWKHRMKECLPSFNQISRMENFPQDTFDVYYSLGSYCNLHCYYCSQREHKDKEIDIKKAIRTARQFYRIRDYILEKSKGKVSTLHLQGGEPTTYPLEIIYDSIRIPFNKVNIITNFIKPVKYFVNLYDFLAKRNCKLEVQPSLHTNIVKFDFYRRNLIELKKLRPDIFGDAIYVVEYSKLEDLKKIISLTEEGIIDINLHRIRDTRNVPLEQEYSPEINDLILRYEENLIEKRESLCNIYDKEGKCYKFSKLGNLNSYYNKEEDIRGFICDVPQYSLKIRSDGIVEFSPLCNNKGFFEKRRNFLQENIDFENIHPFIQCKNITCPLNCKKHLWREEYFPWNKNLTDR